MGAVRVYRNLHRGGYSIQAKLNGRGWRVVGHADWLRLTDVTFKVYEHGRQRVIAKQQKDVHAFVIGRLDTRLTLVYNTEELNGVERISYNPYRWGNFYRCEDFAPVHSLSVAYLTPSGVYGR